LIKNPYILEFLDLKEKKDYLEVDLETSLLNKLQDFLLELGKGFSFVARQQRLTTEAGKTIILIWCFIITC
jgi:predicted nuclease of restriction endonuclease-like (RecB) superfamily